MNFDFEEQVMIRKSVNRIRIWNHYRVFFVIMFLSLFFSTIAFILLNINESLSYVLSVSVFLSSITGLLGRFTLINWRGLKKDLLLSKLIEFVS